MMLHMEAGTCGSGVNLDTITALAFECDQSQNYASTREDFDFGCPACQIPFSYISGLLQHVESNSCCEELVHNSSLGIFLRFLKNRI